MSIVLPPETSYPSDLQDWLRFYITKRCDPVFAQATNREPWELQKLAAQCGSGFYPFRRIVIIGDVKVKANTLEAIMRPLAIQMRDLLDLGREVLAGVGKGGNKPSRTVVDKLFNGLEEEIDAVLKLPGISIHIQAIAGRMLQLLDQLHEEIREKPLTL